MTFTRDSAEVEIDRLRGNVRDLLKDQKDLVNENALLRKQVGICKKALEFYASRVVYERLSQFKGDEGVLECSDIAEEALRELSHEEL